MYLSRVCPKTDAGVLLLLLLLPPPLPSTSMVRPKLRLGGDQRRHAANAPPASICFLSSLTSTTRGWKIFFLFSHALHPIHRALDYHCPTWISVDLWLVRAGAPR